MKRRIASLALAAAVTQAITAAFIAGAVTPAVHSKGNAPQVIVTAVNNNFDKITTAVQNLGLTRSQTTEAVRIVKTAKAGNQDPATTLKMLEGVLTPGRMTPLKTTLSAPPPAQK